MALDPPDIGSVSETVCGRPISSQIGFRTLGDFSGQTLMVVIKVVRRIAELSESKGLNPRSKNIRLLFRETLRALRASCLSVPRPDESRSSPLVSTGRLGDDPFSVLRVSPEVGLSEVPLARGWVTCKSASSTWRRLPGPGSGRRRCRVTMRPVAGPRRSRRDRRRPRRERRSGQGRVRAPVL